MGTACGTGQQPSSVVTSGYRDHGELEDRDLMRGSRWLA